MTNFHLIMNKKKVLKDKNDKLEMNPPFTLEVFGSRADSSNATGWRDVISRNVITQKEQRVSVVDGLSSALLFRLRGRRGLLVQVLWFLARSGSIGHSPVC